VIGLLLYDTEFLKSMRADFRESLMELEELASILLNISPILIALEI